MDDERGVYTRFNKYSFGIGAVLGFVAPTGYHLIHNYVRDYSQNIDDMPVHLLLSAVSGLAFATLGIFTSFFIDDRMNKRKSKSIESILDEDTNNI